jgi:hypothetical protein
MHQESDTYYLDQLCLVALSAAFGAVCLSLSTWKSSMLALVLAPQFHTYVLFSGILLVGLAVVRGAILWKSAGTHAAHDHEHDHDHGNCAHGECHEHHHEHEHDHDHAHAHSHVHDHDHDWAPWRYVVLLVPIILFMLGLPNRLPPARGEGFALEVAADVTDYVALVASGTDTYAPLVRYAALEGSTPIRLPFKFLEDAATDESDGARKELSGKLVTIVGQFSPNPANDRQFRLMRLRIKCCAADAVPLKVAIICRESVAGLKADWVEVTGRVEFRKLGGTIFPILQVPSRRAIVPCDPDPNPYVQ